MARSRHIQTRPHYSRTVHTQLRHRVLAWALAALTTLASVSLMVLSSASPAAAATALDPSQFHGVHWSRLGDNFTADRLVLQGLSANDDYNAARSKADAMFATFQSDLGANTVRLPMNPATAAWNTYYGVIDAATARGFKVILCYWAQDGTNMVPPSLLASWNQMWDTRHRPLPVQPAGLLRPDQRADRVQHRPVAELRRHLDRPRERGRRSEQPAVHRGRPTRWRRLGK